MLKLIYAESESKSPAGNLNTSHVKVNRDVDPMVMGMVSNLNTSHVKVNRYDIEKGWTGKEI